jgi:hypothetical protein
VSVAVKKLDRVQSVHVSLEHGLVAIQLAPGNQLTMATLRKVITSNGFSPKEATVVVDGMITGHTGELSLAVDGTDERFTLANPTMSADIRQGVHVEVTGRIDSAKERNQLTVTSVKRLPSIAPNQANASASLRCESMAHVSPAQDRWTR